MFGLFRAASVRPIIPAVAEVQPLSQRFSFHAFSKHGEPPMVSNFSQYSPQGLASQFPGLQGAGWPQMNPGLFGQPGMGGGNVPFGQDSGQAGLDQQYPFGAQTNSFAQTPFTQNPFLQNP